MLRRRAISRDGSASQLKANGGLKKATPWKPDLILEELGLPYAIHSFSFEVVKQKPYTDFYPNGCAPSTSPIPLLYS